MARLRLRYLGHRPGASLGYFTGASVSLERGQTFDVPREGLVLGRRASADLRVASSQVAPHHCRVRPAEEGSLIVEDLGSTNGTEVGGERIRERRVFVGDVITLAVGFDFEVVAGRE